MSFNVLIIPEDYRKDQYVLLPILRRMMAECGKPNANVRVCLDPLGGIGEALKQDRLKAILDRYKMVHLFLLCVDRDGIPGRRIRLEELERWAAPLVGPTRRFIGVDAWQEIEVWVLAGHDFLDGWVWSVIRSEVHPKEIYFVPLTEDRGVAHQPCEGRHQLAEAAVARYDRMRQLCPEDLGDLERRIRDWLEGQAA